LREKRRLRVSENRVLRKIWAYEGRDSREWRKLQIEEFFDLY
jgi:hypothetical protein